MEKVRHNLLQLRNQLYTEKNKSIPKPRQLKKGQSFNLDKIKTLIDQLEYVYSKWENDSLISNEEIVTVVSTKILAKSNRILYLFKPKSSDSHYDEVGAKDPNYYIVGVKIENKKHVFTYALEKGTLTLAISKLKNLINLFKNLNVETIDCNVVEQICNNSRILTKYDIAKSILYNLIVDIYYIEEIKLDYNEELFEFFENEENKKISKIVTFYPIKNVDLKDLLTKVGIKVNHSKFIDKYSYNLSDNEFDLVKNKIPYLVSMSLTNIFSNDKLNNKDNSDVKENDDFEIGTFSVFNMPDPTNEPIVGVIDTYYKENKNSNLYKWIDSVPVEAKEDNLEIIYDNEDLSHATEVCSLIVCGNKLNPHLEDNCGYFRVRHFGIFAEKGTISEAYKRIEDIVLANRDIKVWNISFGDNNEIRKNSISLIASLLDKLSSECDVIFVVCGTNNKDEVIKEKLIGAPADSINSIVVNSVDAFDRPCNYSRKGPVLDFYKKPDLAYYGGFYENVESRIVAIDNHNRENFVQGTSFATPLVTRKVAFLIYKLGLSKEVAKALLISSCKFDKDKDDPKYVGHGILPIKIDDVVKCEKDEILFYIEGISSEYKTCNYDIPFPTQDNKLYYSFQVYFTYFPNTVRNQGVDYANEELEFNFYRLNPKNDQLIPINSEESKDISSKWVEEEELRNNFKKWDNVKVIKEKLTDKTRPKDNNNEEVGFYGFSIRKSRRNSFIKNKDIKFGMVVKVKCIDNKDRYDSFINHCRLKGWVVNDYDIDVYNKINLTLEDDIEFE